MGSFSNYTENMTLEHIVGKTTFARPTAYVALSTVNPGEDGSGMAEPPGGYNYGRVVTLGSSWSIASGGTLSNAVEMVFPIASGSWGTITHFALFDNSVGGNMLGYGTLIQAKLVDNGDTIRFAIGDFIITLD